MTILSNRSTPAGPYCTELISHVDEHLDWMRRRDLAESTMRSRRMVLTWLAEFLGFDPFIASNYDLDRWQSSLPTIAAIRWQTSIITPYYTWLQARGLRSDNPATLLPRPKRKRTMPRPMPEDTLFAAIAEAPMPVLAYLLLAGWCGLRATEIASLQTENVTADLDGGWVALVTGKGGDQRTVPIPTWVHETIAPHLPESGPCFTRIYGDRARQATRKQISQNANYYLKQCGTDHRLHSLRHRVATAILHDTHDVRLVQELLGHSDLATLHVYTGVRPADMARAVNRLPRPVPPASLPTIEPDTTPPEVAA